MLGKLDDEATIYAKEPWLPESASLVLCEPEEGGLPPEAKASGLAYLLEVAIARDLLEDWQASLATEASIDQRCERLIAYVLNDA